MSTICGNYYYVLLIIRHAFFSTFYLRKMYRFRFRFRFELESFFYRTIPPLTYKTYLKNKTSKKTKKGEMGSSHLVRTMSNINFNQFLND